MKSRGIRIGLIGIVAAVLNGCPGTPTEVIAEDCEAPVRTSPVTWSTLSDAALAHEIARACGRVFIGFKESGAVRGVDPQGKNLTSAETAEQMKSFLRERGIEISWESISLPSVVATMPASRDLVREIRRHANIDYLEPIFPGEFLSSHR